MPRRAAFVAGTGTDVGKTYVAASVLKTLVSRGVQTLALKPVASGVAPFDDAAFAASDTARLLGAQNRAVTRDLVETCTPWRFAAPLSPDLAAAAECRLLPFAEVVTFCRNGLAGEQEVTLVEGAGGIMSPIATDGLNIDLAAALDLPVLLVGHTSLGAVSHTLSALSVLQARGLRVAGVVVNETPGAATSPDGTCAILERFAPQACLWPLGRDAPVPQALVAAILAA